MPQTKTKIRVPSWLRIANMLLTFWTSLLIFAVLCLLLLWVAGYREIAQSRALVFFALIGCVSAVVGYMAAKFQARRMADSGMFAHLWLFVVLVLLTGLMLLEPFTYAAAFVS